MQDSLFDKYYYTIFAFDAKTNDKTFLGDMANRKCRFCGKTEPDVTFRNKAHAVPELLNNRKLFSLYECDKCNQRFSKTVEDQLGVMLTPYRAFRQLRKKGGGNVQLPNPIRININNGNLNVKTPLLINEKKNNFKLDWGIDADGKPTLIFSYTVEYKPIDCYLAFVKMALSLMPENELGYLQWAFQWLQEEPNIGKFKELLLIEQVVKTTFSSLFTKLYKVSASCPLSVPAYAFTIAYYDLIFTIFLPANGKAYDGDLLKEFPWQPNLNLGLHNFVNFHFEDMNCVEKIPVTIRGAYSGSMMTISFKNIGKTCQT